MFHYINSRGGLIDTVLDSLSFKSETDMEISDSPILTTSRRKVIGTWCVKSK